jgi:methylated-DNA-[protein]-cysteine S-methyltransferase
MSHPVPSIHPTAAAADAVIAFSMVNHFVEQPLSLCIHTSPEALVGIDYVDRQADQAPRSAMAERVVSQLLAYFDDPQHPFDLPLNLHGTEFQQRLWATLCRMPSGQVDTYGEMARKLRTASRAVGQACRRNPVPIVVPCHRVISQSGLGGYGGAVAGDRLRIKQALLAHEGVVFD